MTKQISLTQNKVALVDDKDYTYLIQRKWIAQNHGHTWYVVASGNPWLSMHRVIMRCPMDKIVDHKNHDGLDNRRGNLRITTDSGNQHNRNGVRGYYWETARKKWYASIMVDYKKTLLGRFDTEEEAAAAYQAAKTVVLSQIFGSDEIENEDDA